MKLIQPYLKKAKDFMINKKNIISLTTKAYKKFNKEKISTETDKFKTLISLVKDYSKGNYRQVSKKTIFYLIAAILYFVNPLDFIPDFIFGIGFIDDLSVLGFTYKKFSDELKKYKEWKINSDQLTDSKNP